MSSIAQAKPGQQQGRHTPEQLFTNVKPSPVQESWLDDYTAAFIEIAEELNRLPESRFKSLAMTKLEEASMWAKKAVVFTVAAETGNVNEGSPSR